MRAPREPLPTLRRSQARTLTGRQAELLDQLEGLILERGFADLTLDEIASELRCAKVTLYNLAPSREQLNLTVLRRFFNDANLRIEAKIQPIKEPEKRIRTLLRATGEEMQRMASTCFNDITRFDATYQLYDAFSRSLMYLLVGLLEEVIDPKYGSQPMAIGETVRITLDDIYSGEFEFRTGISRDQSLSNLSAMVAAMIGPSRKRSSAPQAIRRIK